MSSSSTPLLYAGFDLGTSNSAAAVFDGETVAVVRNSAGGAVTPSVVRIDKLGHAMVGARARRMLESDAANTATEFKRLMGTRQYLEFPAAGVRRLPEELSAEVLRSLRNDVRDQVGVEVARAVISVPALFELPQSSATSEAARLAGFEQVELLPEPIASALAAGWRADDAGDAAWLVYDLGGGTFDASLLETRDGLLRVVGHDGDNFLGGRDLDWAITEHLAKQIAIASGVLLERKNPAHAQALRTLRAAAEDAKIELSRQTSTQIVLPQPLRVDARDLAVDLELDRDTLEQLCQPVIDRSLEVCLRLLSAHGQKPGRLARVVLVGGPSVMPIVRARVEHGLGSAIAEGLDPMTLVAQGAAIYAATANVSARSTSIALTPRTDGKAPPQQVWLQYPAVSSDLTPHVVGRFVGAATDGPHRPAKVKLVRDDGQWESVEHEVDRENCFVATVTLRPRKISRFALKVTSAAGTPLEVSPAEITMVQGVTIGDPPLARTIGVALANNHVKTYLERGTPLPARRTFTHRVVETVAQGSAESVLQIPIVQGEFDHAHLCRLVGSLTLSGTDLKSTVVTGTDVEVTIELDRGGRMTARALIPSIDQVFEHVVHLLVPDATPETLSTLLGELRDHLGRLRTSGFRGGVPELVKSLAEVESRLDEAAGDIDAAVGGDADAAQKARRTLIEIDAKLADADLMLKWPEIDAAAMQTAIYASTTVSSMGTEVEQRLLEDVMKSMEGARSRRDAAEVERQMLLLNRLAASARNRSPETWRAYFDDVSSKISIMTDVPRAQQLVTAGRDAIHRNDDPELRTIVRKLWDLTPDDPEARRRGYDSGVH